MECKPKINIGSFSDSECPKNTIPVVAVISNSFTAFRDHIVNTPGYTSIKYIRVYDKESSCGHRFDRIEESKDGFRVKDYNELLRHLKTRLK